MVQQRAAPQDRCLLGWHLWNTRAGATRQATKHLHRCADFEQYPKVLINMKVWRQRARLLCESLQQCGVAQRFAHDRHQRFSQRIGFSQRLTLRLRATMRLCLRPVQRSQPEPTQ